MDWEKRSTLSEEEVYDQVRLRVPECKEVLEKYGIEGEELDEAATGLAAIVVAMLIGKGRL